MGRVVEVGADRWDGWLARFVERNPEDVGPQRISSIDRFDHARLAVLLIRRGGYAVALADPSGRVAHKVGSRYVQSRTAAGGWSQPRFARRRANQAEALVGAVGDHLVRLMVEQDGFAPDGLITGGDRDLCVAVLEHPRLDHLTALPTREFANLRDPNAGVLADVLQRARTVRVTIED